MQGARVGAHRHSTGAVRVALWLPGGGGLGHGLSNRQLRVSIQCKEQVEWVGEEEGTGGHLSRQDSSERPPDR